MNPKRSSIFVWSSVTLACIVTASCSLLGSDEQESREIESISELADIIGTIDEVCTIDESDLALSSRDVVQAAEDLNSPTALPVEIVSVSGIRNSFEELGPDDLARRVVNTPVYLLYGTTEESDHLRIAYIVDSDDGTRLDFKVLDMDIIDAATPCE